MTMRTRLRSLSPRGEKSSGRRAASRGLARHGGEAAVVDSDPPRRPDARELRIRASGGPQDCAHYGCQCGYQFSADVATSVCCPHCGASQAW